MGQQIVITGVSRGLGLAMTEQLIERGHTVFGCARSPEVMTQLNQRFGSPNETEMLQICFGEEASAYPSAQRWAAKAVPFILKLQPKDNGRSLTVPI